MLILPPDFKAHLEFDLTHERQKLVIDNASKNLCLGSFKMFFEIYHINKNLLINYFFKCQYQECERFFLSENKVKYCPDRKCGKIKNSKESPKRSRKLREAWLEKYIK